MAKAESKTILKAYSTVESKLPTLPLEDGQLIFVYDKKKIILDNHGVRTVYEQIQTIETEEQRNDLLAPIDSFYFVIETSILWRYSNGHWNQITTSPQEQIDRISAEGTKQVKAVQDKGTEVLQSIPEDFATQMETKLDKQQGIENKGKALVIGEDGNVVPGEVASGGGDGIAIINTMSGKSPLVIPDSAERVNKRLELGGKTEQVTTSGAQLFDANQYGGVTKNGITVTVKDGVITATGTPNINTWIQVFVSRENYQKLFKPENKIYLKTNKSKDCNYDFGIYGAFGSPIIGTIREGNSGKVLPAELPRNDTDFYFFIDVKIGIELKGSIKPIVYHDGNGTWEPYTGGKPSPSPEYPQEIKNVGKRNDEKQKYEIVMQVKGADTELQSLTLTSDRPITKWDRLVEQGGEYGWLYGSVIATIDETADISLYAPNGFFIHVKNIDKKEKSGYCDKLYTKKMSNGEPFVLFGIANNNFLYTLNTQEFYGKTATEIKAKLKEYPLNIIGKSETTEFVPLPQSEQNAIRALKTYYPTTVITVDGGELDTDVEITYTADTKNYIDNKFAQLQKSLVNTNTQLL